MLRTAFGLHIPWWLIVLVAFALVWTLTHYGIQLSMRVTALLGGIELLIMLSLAVTFLLHPGPGSTYLAPLNPALSPHHFAGILAGMVFSVLALSGFEGPAPLAQESRRAAKFVGQAVILSLVATGGFYIFTAYASAIGWGAGDMAAFATHPNPYYALGRALWGAGWWFVVLALINSVIGVGLACTNSASRVMYTMGQAGTLPAWFGRVHPVHHTPTSAIAFTQMVGIVAVLLVGLLLQPAYIFGLLETIATLAVIVIYCMANLALTSYIRREHRANFSVWHHLVSPWLATVALLPVLFVTIYPVPERPYNMAPYFFAAALIVGFAYMQWREARNPGALRRGATMLVGSRSTAEGDVDWDKPIAPL
jgi:amino acid transporter